MSDLRDTTIETSKTEKEGGKKKKRKTRTKYPWTVGHDVIKIREIWISEEKKEKSRKNLK